MVDLMGTIGGAFGGLGKGVGGFAATLGKLLPWLLALVLLAMIIFILYAEVVLFKHKVRLKQIVGNGFRWIEDKAKEGRLKNGARYWQLKELKIKKAIPPDDVLIIDKRGKTVALGYLTQDNQIFWSKDSFNLKDLEEKVEKAKELKSKNFELSSEDKALLTFKETFQPVATNDRIIAYDAMQESDFGKKDFHKIIERVLPYAIILIFMIIFLFGFKYYAGPISEYGQEIANTVAPIAENNKQTAEYLYMLKNDIQVMKQDINIIKSNQNKNITVNG